MFHEDRRSFWRAHFARSQKLSRPLSFSSNSIIRFYGYSHTDSTSDGQSTYRVCINKYVESTLRYANCPHFLIQFPWFQDQSSIRTENLHFTKVRNNAQPRFVNENDALFSPPISCKNWRCQGVTKLCWNISKIANDNKRFKLLLNELTEFETKTGR